MFIYVLLLSFMCGSVESAALARKIAEKAKSTVCSKVPRGNLMFQKCQTSKATLDNNKALTSQDLKKHRKENYLGAYVSSLWSYCKKNVHAKKDKFEAAVSRSQAAFEAIIPYASYLLWCSYKDSKMDKEEASLSENPTYLTLVMIHNNMQSKLKANALKAHLSDFRNEVIAIAENMRALEKDLKKKFKAGSAGVKKQAKGEALAISSRGRYVKADKIIRQNSRRIPFEAHNVQRRVVPELVKKAKVDGLHFDDVAIFLPQV